MKRILLVDDDPFVRDALKAFFDHEGYAHEEATDGYEALALLESGQSFDLIITDNHMPVMTGMEFLVQWKTRYDLRAIPVVLYTGTITNEERQEAFSLGVVAVLDKPLLFSELGSTVARILELSRVSTPMWDKKELLAF